MQDEKLFAEARIGASLISGRDLVERGRAIGVYRATLLRNGEIVWEDEFDNVVTTVGKNALLDAALAGSAYTVAGPFIGLMSSVSYGVGAAAGDTMASHAGWTEAGVTNAPTYSGGRKTAAWAAASGGAKSLSAAAAFTFTGAGTVKGAFMAFGTGAVSTVDSTAGVLLSAGLLAADRLVAISDVLNISYTLSI